MARRPRRPRHQAADHASDRAANRTADGSAEAQGDLQSVVLHDLTLKHAKSTFPISVGAHVFGVDASTFSSTGESFSAIFTPGTDRRYDTSLQKDPVDLAYSFSSKFPGAPTFRVDVPPDVPR